MELFGYLDPGSGSLFVQSIIGVVLASSVIFREALGKVVAKAKVFAARRSPKDAQ